MNREYNLTLVTPPAVEPLELDEVKKYLKVDDITDEMEDDYINSLITVSREYCEEYQHRAFITQTWELTLKEFPCDNTNMMSNNSLSSVIEIPKGRLQKINSFSYKDLYGNVHALTENVDYIVSSRGILGRVCPPYGTIFPCVPLYPLDPIVISFTCGYGNDGSKVPAKVKQAMYLLISHWYDNRAVVNDLRGVDPTKEMTFAVTSLLMMDRIMIL